jgi:hypothetical protein
MLSTDQSRIHKVHEIVRNWHDNSNDPYNKPYIMLWSWDHDNGKDMLLKAEAQRVRRYEHMCFRRNGVPDRKVKDPTLIVWSDPDSKYTLDDHLLEDIRTGKSKISDRPAAISFACNAPEWKDYAESHPKLFTFVDVSGLYLGPPETKRVPMLNESSTISPNLVELLKVSQKCK